MFVRFLLCFLFYYSRCAFAVHSPPQLLAPHVKCVKKEREALLNFKQQLINHTNRLSSWVYQMDCCEWHGVHCNNQTGNVIKIDLHGPFDIRYFEKVEPLYGEISPSLLELKYLEYLDLSCNDFSGRIPLFFGSFTRLQYLNLSRGGLSGTIPDQLGNLSSLRTLDLSSNFDLSANDLKWLPHLQSLRKLYLDYLNLSNANDWANAVSSLPMLRVLRLFDCDLPQVTPFSLKSVNYSRFLSVVDVSDNHLDSSVFIWLFNFSRSLTEIDLSYNSLKGPIPNGFANMVSLMHLDLSHTMLEGGIPNYFGNFSSLKSLFLSTNYFTGQMQEVIKTLSSSVPSTLEYLNLDDNLISGPSIDTIAKLSSLKELRLRSNKLNGSMPKAFGKSFPNLRVLDLAGNQISGILPESIGLLSNLRFLDLSENQISGILPESIGVLSNLEVLYLGSNHFEGSVSQSHFMNLSSLQVLHLSFNSRLALRFFPNWIPAFQLEVLRVGHCKIGPHVPQWLQTQKNMSVIDMSAGGILDIPSWFGNRMSSVKLLDLSGNLIDRIPLDLDKRFSDLQVVNLSSNYLKGPIPLLPNTITFVDLSKNRLSGKITILCNSLYNLEILDLSDNQLSGELPNCWLHLPNLRYLNLDNNNLFGKVPSSMGSLSRFETLQLRNNSFTGELPRSWKYSKYLSIIDLGQNKLSGTIPTWVGTNLAQVVILDLSSNNFSGSIPENICYLSRIQILDLSRNRFSGAIPKCISNFSAMTLDEGSSWGFIGSTFSSGHLFGTSVTEATILTWKGKEVEYRNTLNFVKSIDLSSNNLTTDIPLEITTLIGLIALNLSRNRLTGILPPEIGNLQFLDFLDLSRNQICGKIPSSLSQISRLAMLDLSFNNLTGRIPTSTQLQSFDALSFTGNPELCGKPLTDTCPPDEQHQNPNKEQEDKLITTGFYLSMGLGFVVGFWGVCGTLILNRSLRVVFFESISSAQDYLYVILALKLSHLRRRLRGLFTA